MNFVDAIERGEPPANAEPDRPRLARRRQCAADDRRAARAPRPQRLAAAGADRRGGRRPDRGRSGRAAGRRRRRARSSRCGRPARRRAAAPRPERCASTFSISTLPPDRIALRPASPRDRARLLQVDGRRDLGSSRARPAAPAARAATCWSSTTPGSSRPSSRAGAARRGSAPPCTSARGRAPGAPSSATPSGCARATGSISARASPRWPSERAEDGSFLLTFEGDEPVELLLERAGPDAAAALYRRPARRRRARPRRLSDHVRARGGRGRRADRRAPFHAAR